MHARGGNAGKAPQTFLTKIFAKIFSPNSNESCCWVCFPDHPRPNHVGRRRKREPNRLR